MKQTKIAEYVLLIAVVAFALAGFKHLKKELHGIEQMASFDSVHYNVSHDAFGWSAAEAKFKRHIEESNVVCIAFGRGKFGSFKIDNKTEWPIMIVASTNHATVITNGLDFQMSTNSGGIEYLYMSGFYFDMSGMTNLAALKIN